MTPAIGLTVMGCAAGSVVIDRRWGCAAAAATCAVLGTLFIPPLSLYAPSLVWRDLLVAIGLVALLVAARDEWKQPPPLRLLDLAVAALVLLPAITAIVNRQPLSPASLEVVEEAARWGVPYLAGRLLLRSTDALRVVAAVVVVATAAYAPLCLVESLTRPSLGERVFGVEGPTVGPTRMLFNFWGPNGYRPYGFVYNFFELVLLQVSGLVFAVGLWLSTPRNAHPAWRLIAVAGGVVNALALVLLSRSWAGILLPAGTLGLMGLLLLTRWRIWLLAACLLAPAYLTLRATETIPTSPLPIRNADGAEFLAGRGRSINARTIDERQVFDAVRTHPWFGTGATYRVENGGWKISSKYTLDGGAFMMLLRHGCLGLMLLLLVTLGPAVFTIVSVPTTAWREGHAPLLFAAGVILVAYTVNLIPNQATAALYPLLGGGLVSLSRRSGGDAHPL